MSNPNENEIADKKHNLQKAKNSALNYAKEAYHLATHAPSRNENQAVDYAEVLHHLSLAHQHFQKAYVYDQMLMDLGQPCKTFESRNYPDYLSNIKSQMSIVRLQLEHKNAARSLDSLKHVVKPTAELANITNIANVAHNAAKSEGILNQFRSQKLGSIHKNNTTKSLRKLPCTV